MKPWQTSLNKAPNRRGRENRNEDSSLSQKSKTQSGSLQGKGTNHVLKPHQLQETYNKKR
jgi:hypothetical protein